MEGARGVAGATNHSGMTMKRSFFWLHFCNFYIGVVALSGCATERTEYHYRSQSMAEAMGRPVDETFVKADGTKVVYSSKRPGIMQDNSIADVAASNTEQPALDVREMKANGQVVFRAIFPEQVLDHVIECVRNEEYDLMWTQLLSDGAQKELDTKGGLKYFYAFFAANRKEVMATLNCMKINFKNGHVIIRKKDDLHLIAQLDATLRKSYKFTTMEFESTPAGMKLVSIR